MTKNLADKTRDWRWCFLYESIACAIFVQMTVTVYFIHNYKTAYLREKDERIEYISEDQRLLNYISDFLDIRVFSNDKSITIMMTNTGDYDIDKTNWTVHFNTIVKPEFTAPFNKSGLLLDFSGGLRYLIKPDPHSYKSFKPQSNRSITVFLQLPIHCRELVFPRWYVAHKNLQPKIIKSTENSSFVDQLNPQYNRDEQQARSRFSRNALHAQNANVSVCDVIPSLRQSEINLKEPFVNIREYVIFSVSKFKSEAEFLSEKLQLAMTSSSPGTKVIILTDNIKGDNLTAEEYIINFSKQTHVVQIRAISPAGAFYAVQTLISILERKANELFIPSELKIRDKPRFKIRALMIDVARNFSPKETIFKVIEIMSMYKLNTLHLHLSDDEGWRIEIPGLEQLTQIGAHRCHEYLKQDCLHPSFGSGPYKSSSGSGFYTVKDYQEILKYAKRRHVTIIPEIDFPGHSRAAMEAMIQRSRIDKKEELVLHEVGDKSEYTSLYGYPIGTVNICINSTFNFLETIVLSFKTLHEKIQPITKFHLGGDEVGKLSWQQSKACMSLRKIHNDVRTHFISKSLQILEKHNIEMHAWEDGVMPTDKTNGIEPYDLMSLKTETRYTGNIYTNAWDNMPKTPKISRAYAFANAGYKVIMSGGAHLYLDHRYENNYYENGLNWAVPFTDTKRAFFYLPMDLYGNDELNVPKEKKYKLLKPENIVGLQASMFSELVRSPSKLFYMVFPRLLALAERAWHEAPWENMTDPLEKQKAKTKDWSRFSTLLGRKELQRLDMLNITYRIPPPGVTIKDDTLTANVGFPGLDVEFSNDNGKTWIPLKKSEESNAQLTVTLKHHGDILLRTLSADHKRRSATVTIHRSPRR